MSDDQRNPIAGSRSTDGGVSVLAMVMRAYDRAQSTYYGESQTVSNFKLDLSKSRCEELDSEKAATRDRLFSEG